MTNHFRGETSSEKYENLLFEFKNLFASFTSDIVNHPSWYFSSKSLALILSLLIPLLEAFSKLSFSIVSNGSTFRVIYFPVSSAVEVATSCIGDLNLHSIFASHLSADFLDILRFSDNFATRLSHVSDIQRSFRNFHGLTPISSLKDRICHAFILLILVDAISALVAIHFFIHSVGIFTHFISRTILFFAHSTPHFMSAVPYFPVLLAIAHTAGTITFSASGHSTAPPTVPIISSLAVGSSHRSASVYAGVPVAPITAPLPAVASSPPPFSNAPPAYPTGAVSAMTPPVFLASICCCVNGFHHVIPAIVISSPIFFAPV